MSKITTTKSTKRIVITGGHHNSAMPIIEALQKQIPGCELYWFGHKYSLKGDKHPTMEYLQITDMNIPFYDLKAGKVYKTFDFDRLLKVPYGFFQALYLLAKIKPNLILSFGGYLAVPTVLAGYLLRIPAFTHEQTLVVGYANKIISKFAKKVFISWPSSEKYFNKEKVIYSGIPIRPQIYSATTHNYTINNDLPTIYITAGKTGSHKINESINVILKNLLNVCNVIHQCGDHSLYNDFDVLSKTYAELKANVHGTYYVKKFIMDDEIGEVLNVSSLVVSRAGAHIVSELLALEKPAILIPIPWVSHNEQNVNAEFLVKAGLAQKLNEHDLTSEILLKTITEALVNLSSFTLKDASYKSYIKSNAAEIIVNQIITELNK